MINEGMQAALHNVVQGHKAAVVVIDMQNDFCHEDGATSRHFGDVTLNKSMAEPINAFLDTARAAGIPVVHVKSETTEENITPAQRNKLLGWKALGIDNFAVTDMCGKGSWGAEFYGVTPQPGEPVISKHTYSAFAHTRLDLVLKSLDVDTVILVGVTANVCVESTARDAFFADYNVVVVRDLVGWTLTDTAMAEATFMNIAIYMGFVCTTDDILEAWEERLPALPAAASA